MAGKDKEREEKKKAKLKSEIIRMEKMFAYERQYADFQYICGVDEAGRGPLAGPVVAGAVILPKDCDILYLDDSKKLSPKKREMLYTEITKKAVAYATGMVSPHRIDEINILQATYEAMRTAISNLKIRPDILLNDAVRIPDIDIRQVPIIKGDAKSASIAAASIIAKVERDRLMVQYEDVFPGYDFAKNKGYGTKAHMEAVKALGITPVHRRSFIKDNNYNHQEMPEPEETENKRTIGAKYEQAAGRHLEKLGYKILKYNFYCRFGEIDIIARDGEYLVFAEVKYRKTGSEGHPLEAVTKNKQRAICKCALYFMEKYGLMNMPVRFDAVGILGDDIEVVQDAFPYVLPG